MKDTHCARLLARVTGMVNQRLLLQSEYFVHGAFGRMIFTKLGMIIFHASEFATDDAAA